MDLNFDTLLDMEPRTPTRPSTPTPTKICSQLQQLAKEVDQFSTFLRLQQFTIDALKASGIYDSDNPYVKELLNRLYEFTDLHHQAVSEYSSLSPCVIDGCPHHDFPTSTPIITISDTQDNSNGFIMETENSHPTKRKEKRTPPSSKISKFNDIQPNFQIELASKFNTLSQETPENNLTTDSASTTIPNTVKAPLPKENTLNAPTLNQNTLNAPTPNYVPPPIMLKVTDTYKQQMKIITDKLPSTRGKLTGEYLKLYTNTNELHRQLIHILEDLKYEFYVITPKEKRPIKVVIKGLTRDTKTDEIKNDLIELGFTVDKHYVRFEEVCKESHLLDKLSTDQIKELKNVIIKNRELFPSDPGTTHLMKMDIELISGKPIKTKPCRMSPRQSNILNDEIKRLLDLGGIEIGQPDFTSPLILVESPNRDPRPCVDYRRLNGVTRIEFFPWPNIEENCGKGWRRTICDGLSRLE
ncbi:retrovirus-related Pol polyprotein from transposon 17.6 [Trichonephila inaurata madagascariensis]|uniref:Retrovirus-related Pol polyprotein from transposon 17.6 n=1 Tax=Trichonephila inaurata madagascariensis TaxID=2747483 RepID=A0A8X6YSZ3_9ARAC|nr:retrovirus-related Pol polyprotein from transposon 17.6 [Trichonephila inaurata madagascariensis]